MRGLRLVLCSLAFAFIAAVDEPTLRIGLTQEPGTLNPIVGNLAIETDILQFTFSGLTRYGERGERVPDLAERVPTRENGDISADGRTITYHIVRNARWHDGVPLTSQDVKFTYDAIMNPNNNVVDRSIYEQIERVDTPDRYTARLVLKRPWAPVLEAFSNRNQGAIVPEHILAKYADLNHIDFNGAPIGSGPYRLLAWRRGSEMLLEANPDFYRGAPKIKRITIRFLTNDNTMTIALRAHELDVGDKLNIATYANLGTVPGMLPAISISSWWEHLTFNHGRSPLDDRRVRLALCYGFDVKEIYSKVAHGLGVLGPTSENPVTRWYNRRLDYYPFDPEKAMRILQGAGWKVGPDGVRVKDGKRLSLTFISTSGNLTREQTQVLLQERWKAIGVEVVIKNSPAATIFALKQNGGPFYSGNYDVALSAFIQPYPDPNRINFNNDDRIPPLGNNLSYYRSSEITHLEDAAASTYDETKRKQIYDRIQEIELRDLPYYTIRWVASTDVRSAALRGVRPGIVGSNFWNVTDWRFVR